MDWRWAGRRGIWLRQRWCRQESCSNRHQLQYASCAYMCCLFPMCFGGFGEWSLNPLVLVVLSYWMHNWYDSLWMIFCKMETSCLFKMDASRPTMNVEIGLSKAAVISKAETSDTTIFVKDGWHILPIHILCFLWHIFLFFLVWWYYEREGIPIEFCYPRFGTSIVRRQARDALFKNSGDDDESKEGKGGKEQGLYKTDMIKIRKPGNTNWWSCVIF